MTKEDVWVTYTCRNKKCESAFMNIDETNAQDEPPDYKYCPECVANGFKNTIKNKNEYLKKLEFDNYLARRIKEENITDIDDLTFITNKCNQILKENKEFKRQMVNRVVINQAIEVLGYMKEV